MQKINEIEIKGTKINLTKLGIDFNLNDQQIEALNKISDFIIDKNNFAFTLMGYAGTGKSSIVKILLKWVNLNFRFFEYEITAPTHRAKFVIESLSGDKSNTIHSILGLMKNVDVEKLDNRTIQFDPKKPARMPKDLLIIDEASMINDKLFELIIEKVKLKNTQVLFLGDSAQLKPVGQVHVSKVFNIDQKYELTKVERQDGDNPLGPILDNIRRNIWSEEQLFEHQSEINKKNEGILCTNSSQEFISLASESLKSIFDGNFLQSRILAFTRDRVKLYNKIIRKKFGFEEEYVKGELLMAYQNVGEEQIVNACDYIIDNKPIKRTINICNINCIAWEVALISTDKKNYVTQYILSTENDEDVFEQIGEEIENTRLLSLHEQDRFKKIRYWKQYYNQLESFISSMDIIYDGRIIKPKSIDYGYSFTIHKSQGGTYEDIFVDTRDISICKQWDIQQHNQLLYVGLSRTKKLAHIFH